MGNLVKEAQYKRSRQIDAQGAPREIPRRGKPGFHGIAEQTSYDAAHHQCDVDHTDNPLPKNKWAPTGRGAYP
ncbi:hypothetical protein GCM10025857_16970 [Alicyclobacillus contaminans]|nr:hypothetical protein GCM10025857_16970 [Alicyclobacillus contaminans]